MRWIVLVLAVGMVGAALLCRSSHKAHCDSPAFSDQPLKIIMQDGTVYRTQRRIGHYDTAQGIVEEFVTVDGKTVRFLAQDMKMWRDLND